MNVPPSLPLCVPGGRTLVLDLDGTLIDTVPDLSAALNRLMRARGLTGFTLAETAAMVGDGVARLVGRPAQITAGRPGLTTKAWCWADLWS